MDSKNITILVIGSIITFVFTFAPYFNQIQLNDFTTVYLFILVIMFCIGGILWAFHTKVNEQKRDLNILKFEQKKLGEKLKIYERLSKVEAMLGI